MLKLNGEKEHIHIFLKSIFFANRFAFNGITFCHQKANETRQGSPIGSTHLLL